MLLTLVRVLECLAAKGRMWLVSLAWRHWETLLLFKISSRSFFRQYCSICSYLVIYYHKTVVVLLKGYWGVDCDQSCWKVSYLVTEQPVCYDIQIPESDDLFLPGRHGFLPHVWRHQRAVLLKRDTLARQPQGRSVCRMTCTPDVRLGPKLQMSHDVTYWCQGRSISRMMTWQTDSKVGLCVAWRDILAR